MKILSSDDPICVELVKSLGLENCNKLTITMEATKAVVVEAKLLSDEDLIAGLPDKLVKYKLVEIEDEEGELPRKDLFIPNWGKKGLE